MTWYIRPSPSLPQCHSSYFDMAAIEMELSVLLGGRAVALRTAPELSKYFRYDVVRTAAVRYAA